MKFDMHCHTRAGSIDSKVETARYIELLKEQGFDGMLITDHDSYKGYYDWLSTRDSMPDEIKDFVVLKGVEYDTKDAGHFIVILPDHVHLHVLRMFHGAPCCVAASVPFVCSTARGRRDVIRNVVRK